ncbi:MAG: methionyl-tRNA formyltransferase [Rickettsiales bacterium]|nr:methionyl-tRNA formyltransferase [Rickettsiales bacterium]
MSSRKKIIFMGSPEFAIPTFQKLLNSHFKIEAVFTRAPREKNRGKKILPTAIQILAEENNIKIFTPTSLRNAEICNKIVEFEPDFLIVVAYGLILPKEVLQIPKYAVLNLHPSALPRFRGAAPLQRTLMAGDNKTEICIMKMNEGLDEGDVYLRREINIPAEMNFMELHDKTSEIGAEMILEVLENFSKLRAIPQDNKNIVYADKISKGEAEINFSKNGTDIFNLIRALNPFPAAYFFFKNERIKIYEAEFKILKHDKDIGYIDAEFNIYCANGLIKPKILQREGKKKTVITEFLRGLR